MPPPPDDDLIRVLVIDDEAEIGEMIVRYNADSTRHAFTAVTDPLDGLERALRGEADVVVTDIRMPAMNGYELARRIREREQFLPIIALSGHAIDPEGEIRALECGASYFLRKPFDQPTLLAAIDALHRSYAAELAKERSLNELAESKQLLQSILDNTPDVVLVKDRHLRYLLVNQAARKLLPENTDIEGHGPEVFFSDPGDFRRVREESERILRTGCSLEVEDSVVSEGGERVFQSKKFPLTDERGLPWAVCTMSRDVTREKRLVKLYETNYQAIRHARNPIVITDPLGRIEHVNQAFEELYGFKESEVLGLNPRILNPGREAYLDQGWSEEKYYQLFANLWASILDPALGYWEGDLMNRRQNGDLVWVRLFVHAVRDGEGNLLAFSGMPVDMSERLKEERAIRVECYRALADLAEARDEETGAHLRRISLYARLLSQQLGRSSRFVEEIDTFSPLHDIGKVGIPDSILLAPRKLEPDEWEIMKTHSAIGYDILRDRPTMEMAADIAHCHHERWDGTGYPRGLAGEDIPASARIVALTDVYDALRSSRPYKEAWPHAKACEIIVSGKGSHFDPAVVEAFLALEAEFERISIREAD